MSNSSNQTIEQTDNKVVLTLTGLKKGVGSTIGNFIRRAYFHQDSSTEVIGVKINDGNISTQFQAISGVVEDSQALIANIQDLKFTPSEEDKLIIAGIMNSGNSEITAQDLTVNSVQILNPDKHIAHKREETPLTVQVFLLNAKGYRSKELNRLKLMEEQIDMNGVIVLDSNHKTITKAFFNIVEETTSHETLVLTVVSTNGGLNKVTKEVQDFIQQMQSIFN